VSDIPVPETTGTGPLSRDGIRSLASSWWLFLALGVLWILFGMFVLSYNVGSLLALAVFAGVTFLMTGITQVMTAGRVESWRWLYLVGGALSIIAGIMAFVWPGRTLLVLAGILSWFLVFKGIVDVVGALASIRRSFWWVGLILGIVELLVGIWAAGYPGRSRPVGVPWPAGGHPPRSWPWALLPQPAWGCPPTPTGCSPPSTSWSRTPHAPPFPLATRSRTGHSC
jgi:uncharacterized membrane protein HdeD (DUF308 family)